MRELILTIAGGMGLLIFFYLLFMHGDSAVSLVNALGGTVNTNVKTLQGR
jgi:hypothetical protein